MGRHLWKHLDWQNFTWIDHGIVLRFWDLHEDHGIVLLCVCVFCFMIFYVMSNILCIFIVSNNLVCFYCLWFSGIYMKIMALCFYVFVFFVLWFSILGQVFYVYSLFKIIWCAFIVYDFMLYACFRTHFPKNRCWLQCAMNASHAFKSSWC